MSAPSCMAFPFRSQHSADRKHRMKLLLQTKPITYQRHQESKWEVRKKSATLPFYKGAPLWERTETAVAVSFLSLWPEHRNATKVKKETGAAVSQWETVSEGLTGGGGGGLLLRNLSQAWNDCMELTAAEMSTPEEELLIRQRPTAKDGKRPDVHCYMQRQSEGGGVVQDRGESRGVAVLLRFLLWLKSYGRPRLPVW